MRLEHSIIYVILWSIYPLWWWWPLFPEYSRSLTEPEGGRPWRSHVLNKISLEVPVCNLEGRSLRYGDTKTREFDFRCWASLDKGRLDLVGGLSADAGGHWIWGGRGSETSEHHSQGFWPRAWAHELGRTGWNETTESRELRPRQGSGHHRISNSTTLRNLQLAFNHPCVEMKMHTLQRLRNFCPLKIALMCKVQERWKFSASIQIFFWVKNGWHLGDLQSWACTTFSNTVWIKHQNLGQLSFRLTSFSAEIFQTAHNGSFRDADGIGSTFPAVSVPGIHKLAKLTSLPVICAQLLV